MTTSSVIVGHRRTLFERKVNAPAVEQAKPGANPRRALTRRPVGLTSTGEHSSDRTGRHSAMDQAGEAAIPGRDGDHNRRRPDNVAATRGQAVWCSGQDDRSLGSGHQGRQAGGSGLACPREGSERGSKAGRPARCRVRRQPTGAPQEAARSQRRPADQRHQDAGRAPNHPGQPAR